MNESKRTRSQVNWTLNKKKICAKTFFYETKVNKKTEFKLCLWLFIALISDSGALFQWKKVFSFIVCVKFEWISSTVPLSLSSFHRHCSCVGASVEKQILFLFSVASYRCRHCLIFCTNTNKQTPTQKKKNRRNQRTACAEYFTQSSFPFLFLVCHRLNIISCLY